MPYVGHPRIGEVDRESSFNMLEKVLPAEEASQVTVRATQKVLSAMRQMAFDEGYRTNNPIRGIRIRQAPTKPILVASRDQWRLLDKALAYSQPGWTLNITRSTVYVTARYRARARRAG